MRKIFYLNLFIILFSFLFLVKSVLALTLMPAKIELNLNPGDKREIEIYIRNDEDVPNIYYSNIEGFTEEGENKIFLGRVPEVEWFNLPESIALKPKETKSILINLNVPQDAPPGAHPLVLWWSSINPKQQGTGIGIAYRVGILFYINVSGNAIENFEISKLDYQKVIFNLPFKISYVIKNLGNTYINPKGEIIIKNLFGKEIGRKLVNPREVQILPGKEKSMEIEWNPLFALGPYKVNFNVYGQKHSVFKSFWILVLPVKTLVILILILLFVIFVLPRIIRIYNQYIIKKAKERGEV